VAARHQQAGLAGVVLNHDQAGGGPGVHGLARRGGGDIVFHGRVFSLFPMMAEKRAGECW